jgi:hypothetical protein
MIKKNIILVVLIMLLLFIPLSFGAFFTPLPLPPCSVGGGSCTTNVTTLIYNNQAMFVNQTNIVTYECTDVVCITHIEEPTH